MRRAARCSHRRRSRVGRGGAGYVPQAFLDLGRYRVPGGQVQLAAVGGVAQQLRPVGLPPDGVQRVREVQAGGQRELVVAPKDLGVVGPDLLVEVHGRGHLARGVVGAGEQGTRRDGVGMAAPEYLLPVAHHVLEQRGRGLQVVVRQVCLG